MAKKKPEETPDITYHTAARNTAFSPYANAAVRFIRSKVTLTCAHCGKKKKLGMWTTIVPFRAVSFGDHPFAISVDDTKPCHPPLTPVCGDHLLSEDKAVMTELMVAMDYFFHLVQLTNEDKAKKGLAGE